MKVPRNRFWVCLVIFVIGAWLRVDAFAGKHPDQDELFELQALQGKKLSSVFDNKAFYGDHTSFPGEFLIYYLPMKMVLKDPKIDVGRMRVEGMDRNDFWKLAVPKIVLWVVGSVMFYLLCRGLGWGGVLAFAIWCFNYQLVYHAFEMRPYSVLPVLAVANLFMCFRRSGVVGNIFHALLIFFTCIYHAYGLMIVYLPVILNGWFFTKVEKDYYMTHYWMPLRETILWVVSMVGIAGWMYYALYSNFGISPNKVQSVVDSFQYMPKQFFFENLLRQLTGGSLIFYLSVPLLAWSFLRGIRKDALAVLIILVLIPLALIMLVDIKTHYWIHPRQYVWVIPFFALFLGMIVNEQKDL